MSKLSPYCGSEFQAYGQNSKTCSKACSEKYAKISTGPAQSHSPHHVMCSITHGQVLISVPSHHKCANNRCVNPDHLQWVTHWANQAEMMERQAYLARIRQPEEYIRTTSPEAEILRSNGFTVNS